MALMDKLKEMAVEGQRKMQELAAEGQRNLNAQKAQEDAKERASAQVIVSTGDIPQTHRVIDAVFAMDSHQEGFLSAASPAKAFEGVKRQLREASLALGGDAVINCQFEYRVALGQSVFGNAKQCIEIFAYGTAVKLVKDSREEVTKTVGSDTSNANARDPAPQQPSSTVIALEIAFTCPKCAQSLKVDRSCAGQVANCPKCNAEVQIPAS